MYSGAARMKATRTISASHSAASSEWPRNLTSSSKTCMRRASSKLGVASAQSVIRSCHSAPSIVALSSVLAGVQLALQ